MLLLSDYVASQAFLYHWSQGKEQSFAYREACGCLQYMRRKTWALAGAQGDELLSHPLKSVFQAIPRENTELILSKNHWANREFCW